MATRTQITMDPGLRRRAQARASRLGVSFAEYVRRLVARDLGVEGRRPDVSAVFNIVGDGPETDIAHNKDAMIAGAVWSEHVRKARQPGGVGEAAEPRKRRT